jgi:hypothetical protein
MKSSSLSTNSLAFIALCNEYCATVQNAREVDSENVRDFVMSILKLLPRIYICATDLTNNYQESDVYIDSVLEEDYYDTIRRHVENLLGPDDTYLEVFHQDMKYSDTPIAASIAEGLADLFQVFYNFIETVRDATEDVTEGALATVCDDFQSYWSTILCNVLRALNHIYYQGSTNDY